MKKYITLDIMMGLLCIVLVLSILGIALLDDVVEAWGDMRRSAINENQL